MRSGRDAQWLIQDGKMIGISLGADYTAEHEWGINKLKRALGIDGVVQQSSFSREKPKYLKPHGLPRRQITKHDMVRLYKHRDMSLLICEDSYWFKNFDESIAKNGISKAVKDSKPRDLSTERFSTAWDEESFGICVKDDGIQHLKDLYAAFRELNVAMWVGRSMVFENGGLIICIMDRVPADKAAMLKEGDLESERLQAASDATGILHRLEAAKKGYFACSPRWLTDKATKSAHPIVYWLNPTDQHENNFGWFTVEDLDAWISGQGPIPMKEKEKEKAKSR